MLRSISNTPVMSPLKGSSFDFSKFFPKTLTSKRSAVRKPTFGSQKLLKKVSNLTNLAKGSVFFPFTQPTVKSPTGRIIQGRMPSINRVLRNFGKPKTFGGKDDLDYDGVKNSDDCRPRDMTRTHMLKKVVSQRSGHGKGFDQYQTPEGINVVFELTKKTKRDKYPSLDEVGYVLENLPKGTIPKGTTIKFSPRVFSRTWIDEYGKERTRKFNVPLKTGGHAFEDRSDDEGRHTVRVYPQPTLLQLDRAHLVKKYGKRDADRALKGYVESKGFREADEARKKGVFDWGKKVLIHEIAHNIDFDRELKEKYKKEEVLKYKEAPTKYGKKNVREDIAESFVLWSQGKLGIPVKYGDESKRYIPAEIKRKEFFEEHLADIDRTKTPSVREDVESLTTPYSLIHESDKDLSDEGGHTEWSKRFEHLKRGAEQIAVREEDKKREAVETLTPEQRRDIIADMQKEFSQADENEDISEEIIEDVLEDDDVSKNEDTKD